MKVTSTSATSDEVVPSTVFTAPVRARFMLWTLLLSLCALVIWASLAKVDQVTKAPAQFIAADRTQLVQSPEAGVITAIHVKEGDEVSEGQLLVTLEKERAGAAVDDSRAKVAALRAATIRLESELFGNPLEFDGELNEFPELVANQRALFYRRQRAVHDEVNSLERLLSLSQQELKIHERLLPTGDISEAEVLRLRKSVAEISAQISNRRNKYFQEAQAELTKAREELNTQHEQLRERLQVYEHTELRAPADGVVNNIRATTLGAVLRPGDVAMEIYPNGGNLVAEAKVSPTDIAFVKEGQESLVKIDAFDSTVFGGLRGTVRYISPDVLKEETKEGTKFYYRVHILVNSSEYSGKRANEIRLRPGMTAQVEMKAMERTVLNYLTKPIVKTLGESLGER